MSKFPIGIAVRWGLEEEGIVVCSIAPLTPEGPLDEWGAILSVKGGVLTDDPEFYAELISAVENWVKRAIERITGEEPDVYKPGMNKEEVN